MLASFAAEQCTLAAKAFVYTRILYQKGPAREVTRIHDRDKVVERVGTFKKPSHAVFSVHIPVCIQDSVIWTATLLESNVTSVRSVLLFPVPRSVISVLDAVRLDASDVMMFDSELASREGFPKEATTPYAFASSTVL